MKSEIVQRLQEIEEQHRCHILYACESGSRAWGFASPDSDYDVRFIYHHPVDWYFRIDTRPDTINDMLPNDIDVSAWELIKAMKLFAKGNLSLFEWLDSPEIYIKNHQFYTVLKSLIPDYFNPKKALYHYYNMATKTKEKYLCDQTVNIKKLFYIIRPLLACVWINNNKTMPPTEFKHLYLSKDVPDFVRDSIKDLLFEKYQTSEKHTTAISEELYQWICNTLPAILTSSEETDTAKKINLNPLNELIYSSIKIKKCCAS